MNHTAPGDSVVEVGRCQQRRRRDHYDAEFDAGQQGLPQLHLVAQHQQEAVALGSADGG